MITKTTVSLIISAASAVAVAFLLVLVAYEHSYDVGLFENESLIAEEADLISAIFYSIATGLAAIALISLVLHKRFNRMMLSSIVTLAVFVASTISVVLMRWFLLAN